MIHYAALSVCCVVTLAGFAALAGRGSTTSPPEDHSETIFPVSTGTKSDRLASIHNILDVPTAPQNLNAVVVAEPASAVAAPDPKFTPRHWHDPLDPKYKSKGKQSSAKPAPANNKPMQTPPAARRRRPWRSNFA